MEVSSNELKDFGNKERVQAVNMELWNSVEKTNPNHTKKAKVGGMTITSIKPQYQRKQATELFGPLGFGWGVKNESFVNEVFGEGSSQQTVCRYSAIFWYQWKGINCEFPISSNVKVAYTTKNGKGYFTVDDEYAKKASTDALTKGLSFLGFNADIFMGLYDDSKYLNQMNEEFKEKPEFTISNLEAMREKFTGGIATSDKTPDSIIATLEATYTLGDEVKALIRGIK